MAYIDLPRLGILAKAKRGSRGLREMANLLGEISPSTLSRVERAQADNIGLNTFLSICNWLELSPHELIKDTQDHVPPELEIPDVIALLLRDDPKIDPDAARLIEAMLRAAYRVATTLQYELDEKGT